MTEKERQLAAAITREPELCAAMENPDAVRRTGMFLEELARLGCTPTTLVYRQMVGAMAAMTRREVTNA